MDRGARSAGRFLSAWSVAAAIAAALLGAGSLGCAGHESRTRVALDALDRGQPKTAILALNQELEVKSAEELPALKGDKPLLLLDRGTVLLSLDNYKLSARDLGAADKAIDLLDMSRGAADEIGRYLYSDDVGPYKAPAYEKLLVNTVNMMNYLAQHDLVGAKVEARRLAVMQRYIKENEEDSALLGLGSYLAGFAFEKSNEAGERDEALLFYDEALQFTEYTSLRDPLRALTNGEPRSKAIDALVGQVGQEEARTSLAEAGEAEVLVVVGFGRVPQKVPARIPIGLALTLVSGIISPSDRDRANELAVKGLVTWVSFPKLGRGQGRYAAPTLALDGEARPVEEALDVETEVRATWEAKEPTIVLSAITRMLARVAVGELTQAGTTAAIGTENKEAQGLGLLAGLVASTTLTVMDTPDTRAWATLPARFAIARMRVPAGPHEVKVSVRGQTKAASLDLKPGGWAFVPMLVLR